MKVDIQGSGFVKLINFSGSDDFVASCARVSFNKYDDSKESLTSEERDKNTALINYLMKNRHGSPFEHNQFTFLVKAPIFVMREWHRHRIGISINEVSGRYSQIEEHAYWPLSHVLRHQAGKPSEYQYQSLSESSDSNAKTASALIKEHNDHCFDVYHKLIDLGVAREQARMVLPLSTFSSMYWTCNARSLMSFISLRSDNSAQQEIRDFSFALESIFAKLMPVTFKSFIDNGRVSP